MRFTILGAGPGGQAFALGLMFGGHDVRLWFPQWSDERGAKLVAIREEGIHGVGAIEGHGMPEVATEDMSVAVASSEIVVVVTPARAHRSILETLGRFLEPDQMVLLSPGRTGGAFEAAHVLRAMGIERPLVAETSSLPFTGRLQGPNQVLVAGKKEEVGLGCLPPLDPEPLLSAMKNVFSLAARRSVFETSFENLGGVFHVVPMLLSSAQIERSGLDVYYREAVTPAVGRVMEAVDAERLAVAQAYGADVPSAVALSRTRYPDSGHSLHDLIHRNEAYATIGGVDSLTHRYLSDDLPSSIVPFVALAKAAGRTVVLHEALLHVGSALLGEDFAHTGRSLSSMGLEGMDVSAIQRKALPYRDEG